MDRDMSGAAYDHAIASAPREGLDPCYLHTMDVLALRSWPRLALGPSALALLLFTPRAAHAQTPMAHAERHHVDAALGLAFAATSVVEEADALSGACSPTGCPQPPPRTGLPPKGGAWTARLGYRFRPAAFFEVGVSPEGSFHQEAQTYALPLMAYARLPLRDGTGVTLGVGGGAAYARGLDGADRTDAFLRLELGGVVPLGGGWSLALAAQGSVSAKAAFSSSSTIDGYDDYPEWAGFSLGPRYSF